ncbi:MAG: HAMP domain-containing histidine kinase [Bacteroidetes bacterium]|nr:HAMP domain-containing histidine kinase [Bacteroidota bacterium]MBU1579979.1 HAMP domain-containing histidine kinase [Bacteroidota bacterium]MBU2465327.1 HAMP domain-containing histidine kinase [Bacteroidota bacterium]MBU2558686.1 HAMP domain-containing histidine kinase [Bacteroidota bacterium]
MDTYFAPAERASQAAVVHDYNLFTGFGQVNELINALPFIAAVLNEQRQVVYGNKPLLEAMGFKRFEDILGLRPGELINCVHAREMPGGCGTAEACRVCGAVNAIQDCLKSNKKIVNECRITATVDLNPFSYDFEVTASPFQYQQQRFIVLSFEDISDEKRRQVLERLFFHDIINTAGGLRGFIDFLKLTDDPSERLEYTNIASRLSETLIEEILSQRQLLEAERGELTATMLDVDIAEILQEVVHQIEHHQVSKGKTIKSEEIHQPVVIQTDAVLLKRVLLNLLKNALEASTKGEQVMLGVKTDKPGMIQIWIKNQSVIPRDIQLQIFQRSFSTKGVSRGIGTYSIKMFTEQYLGGKVSFVSNEKDKTVFTVALPIDRSSQ